MYKHLGGMFLPKNLESSPDAHSKQRKKVKRERGVTRIAHETT